MLYPTTCFSTFVLDNIRFEKRKENKKEKKHKKSYLQQKDGASYPSQTHKSLFILHVLVLFSVFFFYMDLFQVYHASKNILYRCTNRLYVYTQRKLKLFPNPMLYPTTVKSCRKKSFIVVHHYDIPKTLFVSNKKLSNGQSGVKHSRQSELNYSRNIFVLITSCQYHNHDKQLMVLQSKLCIRITYSCATVCFSYK